jgi:hypothetical protein
MRFKKFYYNFYRSFLLSKFYFKNSLDIPKIETLIINLSLSKLHNLDNSLGFLAKDSLQNFSNQRVCIKKIGDLSKTEGVFLIYQTILRRKRFYLFLDFFVNWVLFASYASKNPEYFFDFYSYNNLKLKDTQNSLLAFYYYDCFPFVTKNNILKNKKLSFNYIFLKKRLENNFLLFNLYNPLHFKIK